MSSFLKLLFLFLSMFYSTSALTEEQLLAAMKIARNICIEKSEVSAAELEKMHHRDWDLDHNGKCFLYCLLNMNKLITSENKMDHEYAVQLVEKHVPDHRKDALIASTTECKDSAVSTHDSCLAAYEMVQCIYHSNPSNFFFFSPHAA